MGKLAILKKVFQSKEFLILLLIFASSGIVLASQKFGEVSDKTKIISKYQVAKTAFPNLSEAESGRVENLVREQIRLIVSKPQFANSLKVTKKHQNKIRIIAKDKNFPADLAIGVALLENGGSETAVSYAGAAGIFQLTEGTAKTLGLKVDKENDERLEPAKNIEAGISYLDQNLQIFSDPGIAVWAHHAGTQNVSRAVKIYLQSVGEQDAYDFVEAEKLGKLDRAKYVWRAYVTRDNLNVHKLLSSSQVAPFLEQFSDETEIYPYKVVAASILFDAASNFEEQEFLEKVKLFNQGRILLSDLLNPG